ncbi:MAG: hypothetical protein ACFHWZ_08910 [Phycisphaerales bacterium]
MNRALTTIGFLTLSITGPLLSGCAGGGAPDLGEPRHTSHLWKTDSDATLALVVAERPDMAEQMKGVTVQQVLGIYDVMLELSSKGAYLMHIRSADRTYESEGAWRYLTTREGTQVRLTPNRTDSAADEEIRKIVRSWVIRIDDNGRDARIESLSGVDTILTRVD